MSVCAVISPPAAVLTHPSGRMCPSSSEQSFVVCVAWVWLQDAMEQDGADVLCSSRPTDPFSSRRVPLLAGQQHRAARHQQ